MTVSTDSEHQTVTLIAAVARNGVIGDGDGMPWHLPEDLAHFKATTMGATMIMGRGTWDSIGRALPGRRTIVVTRNRSWTANGVDVAHSIDDALAMAGPGNVFIVGGGQIYDQTIDEADRLVITHVDVDAHGTVRFPPIDEERWEPVREDPREGFRFVVWEPRKEQGRRSQGPEIPVRQ